MLAFLLLFLWGPVAGASAAVGLDPTFGGGGIVTTPIGPSVGDEDVGFALAIQPDGKLVLAGSVNEDFAVARYNTNGTPDMSFSGDGKVITPMSADEGGSSNADEAHGVVIQDDGKIVVAGFANALSTSGGNGGDFAVARYNTDGTPDMGFSGDGKDVTEPSTFSGPGFALALQDDGKIIVAGRAIVSTPSFNYEFGLVRYKTDGSLDMGFDGDGKLTTDVGDAGEDDEPYAVAIQGDGKIVAAGYAKPTGGGFEEDFALARYKAADGSLDTSFDGDGKVVTPISANADFPSDIANALVIRPGGKIVAAGSSTESSSTSDNFALVSYNANGSLDTGFDGDGKVTTSIGGGSSIAYGLALQSDGKLVAVGRDEACGFDCDFGLARYNSNGTPDTSFDGDGTLVTTVSSGGIDIARTVAIQDNGRIVVGGYADTGDEWLDFTLVRYAEAPETSITSGPAAGSKTKDSTPSFGFTSDEPIGDSFECRVDGGAFGPCSGPGQTHTTAPLADGTHTFRVRATDLAGNVDPTPAVRSFTVDTDPPETSITSGPAAGGRIKDSTPTFGFTSDEPSGDSFKCSVDGAAFGSCSGPGQTHTTASLADGTHTFRVRAIDAAGNGDPSPSSRSFTVDTDPPETSITSGPAAGGTTTDSTPTFGFTSDEPSGDSFKCSVDGAAFGSCSGPGQTHTTASLADGTHTFRVKAIDAAGNGDPTPSVRTFTVAAP